MSSIVQYGDGWRAYLYVAGKRETKLLRTKRECEAWAAARVEELKAGQVTFEQAVEQWLAFKLPQLDNEKDRATVEQSIRQHALPLLGHMVLTDITRKHLVGVVTAVAQQGKVETAHRVGQRIKAILDLQVDSGVIVAHPAAGLARVLPGRQRRHMPALTPAELPGLLTAIRGYPEPVTRLGLLLLAHTFVRTSELIGATWAEVVDPATWVIPAERMKRNMPHVIPLTRPVLAMLDELKALGAGSCFFLPSSVNPLCSLSTNTLLFALYRLGYRGRMTGHGFRAVASSVLNESRLWHPDAIERQLAHGETDRVRAAYHRAEYLEERRRMMCWWSDHIEATGGDRS